MTEQLKSYKLTDGSSIILDLIRGGSAQIVVLGHGLSKFSVMPFLQEPNFPWVQNIAVLIFFLLSGFLITYSVDRKLTTGQDYNFKKFFVDRFSRIYTAYIPALLFVMLIDFVNIYLTEDQLGNHDGFTITNFIGNILMLQDHPIFELIPAMDVSTFGSAAPFWSLAIEWWIYMLFGFLLLTNVMYGRSGSLVNIFILLLLLMVPVYNLIFGRGVSLTTYWLFGAIVYLISKKRLLTNLSFNFKVGLAVLLGCLAGIQSYVKMNGYDPIFAFLLAAVLWVVIDLFRNFRFSSRSSSVVRFIASYSYTLYLIHFTILVFMRDHFLGQMNPMILYLIAFLISNFVSMLIGRYTERHLTKVVKGMMYRKMTL